MRKTAWLALSFGLGWYIGHPSHATSVAIREAGCPAVVQVEEPAKPSPAPSGKTLLEIFTAAGVKFPQPSASASPTPAKEEEQSTSTTDENGITKTATEVKTEETDSDGDPLKMDDEQVKKWIKSVTRSATNWIGRYEADGMKVTLTADKYAHLGELRTALGSQNFAVTEEGSMAVGDLVYYIVVKGK
jgi:hypothetical protein